MVRELQNEEKAPKLDILTTELVPKTPNPVVNASESLESPGIGNWLSSPLSSIAKNNSSYASHVLSTIKNNSAYAFHLLLAVKVSLTRMKAAKKMRRKPKNKMTRADS